MYELDQPHWLAALDAALRVVTGEVLCENLDAGEVESLLMPWQELLDLA